MTTTPEITVDFDDNGEPIISVHGIKGVSCKDASAFLEKGLGVKTNDVFIEVDIDPYNSGRTDLPRPKSTRNITYTETRMEGCRELLQYIIDNKDLNGSIGLWYCL